MTQLGAAGAARSNPITRTTAPHTGRVMTRIEAIKQGGGRTAGPGVIGRHGGRDLPQRPSARPARRRCPGRPPRRRSSSGLRRSTWAGPSRPLSRRRCARRRSTSPATGQDKYARPTTSGLFTVRGSLVPARPSSSSTPSAHRRSSTTRCLRRRLQFVPTAFAQGDPACWEGGALRAQQRSSRLGR